MYEKELQRILTASQNNALTFFVGAGVSALSGAPTWKGLIHAISDRLGQARKDEYSSDEYLQIPQMFYYSLGENKEEYYTFVKAQLHSSPMLPNVIHREMLNLNPVSFITTNYDTLAASLSPSVHDVPSGQVQKLVHPEVVHPDLSPMLPLFPSVASFLVTLSEFAHCPSTQRVSAIDLFLCLSFSCS